MTKRAAHAGKSVGKSVPPQLTPFRKGDGRKRGCGPAKGAPHAGRPPDAFKEMCRDIASRGAQALVAKRVMQNPKHPAFLSALRWATENGYGKAVQPLTTPPGQPIEVRDVTNPKSELSAKIASIAGRAPAVDATRA